MHRVVITGIGIVSPVGIGRDDFWANLLAGKSGISEITNFDASSFPVRIGGQVKDFDVQKVIDDYVDSKYIRDRKVMLGLAAAKEAIEDANLSEEGLQNALLHAGIGLEIFWLDDLTAHAHSDDIGHAMVTELANGTADDLIQTPLDCLGNILGDHYGFSAGKYTNCSACAAGAQTIGQAWQMLHDGQGDIALAGATDSMLNPLGLGGFSLLRVLSDENDNPETACRPFDISRKGTVLGEGAAFVVLENLEKALEREANIYAEIIGYGSSMDAYRVSDPDNDGKGAIASMEKALEAAKLQVDDIDCVSAHGTGTIKNDIVETAAIKNVLGTHAYKIPVHSVKSMTGHMIAASGAAEAIAAALTISRKFVPPTINLNEADVQCDLDYVPQTARVFEGKTVLSNSFGFGGQNATLIFRRYE